MRPFLCLVALLVCLSGTAWCSQEEGGSGIVYGGQQACVVKAPPGWIFDTESGIKQHLFAVIYPKGQSWQTSTVAMYANGADHDGTLQAYIQRDVDAYMKQRGPLSKIETLPILATLDHRDAQVRKFTSPDGEIDVVAYIECPRCFCLITMNAKAVEDLDAAAFEAVIHSFNVVTTTVKGVQTVP